jgi:hypothetical protein
MTWREARHYSHTCGVSVVADWCDHDEVAHAAEAAGVFDISTMTLAVAGITTAAVGWVTLSIGSAPLAAVTGTPG